MQKLIVDGYNVIYTDDRMRRVACRDNERARKRLLELLREYVADRDVQVTVVFDGRGAMVDAEALIPGRLQVVYSARGQTADDVIVRTLEESDQPAAYIVITSDIRDIGRTARAMGCEVIGSKRFLDRISVGGEAKTRHKRAGEKPEPSKDDADYWMNKFEKE